MKKEKVIVGYAIKKDFDFGMIKEESRKGNIKVDKDVWTKYVGLRHDFEVMHESLKIRVGDGFKIRELLNTNL